MTEDEENPHYDQLLAVLYDNELLKLAYHGQQQLENPRFSQQWIEKARPFVERVVTEVEHRRLSKRLQEGNF